MGFGGGGGNFAFGDGVLGGDGDGVLGGDGEGDLGRTGEGDLGLTGEGDLGLTGNIGSFSSISQNTLISVIFCLSLFNNFSSRLILFKSKIFYTRDKK